MISANAKGDFKKTLKFLNSISEADFIRKLDAYGRDGVSALQNATPKDSGQTANSWSYSIEISKGSYSISWYNSHTVGTTNIAIILQYGHGANGGYVEGRDYINPAMRPIFDKMTEELWKVVTTL